MTFAKSWWVAFFTLALIISGCLSTPNVDKEKAGYIAGIKFLESHPTETASYTVSDPGGEAFLVSFSIVSPEGEETGFAEYYVDRYTRDVYVSTKYATLLAIDQSPGLKRLFERYPEAKVDGGLLDPESVAGKRYVWEIRVIANGVDVAVFAFDAASEKLLNENIKTYQVINITPV
jgi:hypothetical protein